MRQAPHSTGNITPGHVRVFQAVTTQMARLASPSCKVTDAGENRLAGMPLFVAITKDMRVDFEGTAGSDGEDGGGPTDPRVARLSRPNRTG